MGATKLRIVFDPMCWQHEQPEKSDAYIPLLDGKSFCPDLNRGECLYRHSSCQHAHFAIQSTPTLVIGGRGNSWMHELSSTSPWASVTIGMSWNGALPFPV